MRLTEREKLSQLEAIMNKYEIDSLEDLDDRLNSYKFLANHDYATIEKNDLHQMINICKNVASIEDELGIDLIVYHKLMDMLYCGEPNILYVKDKDTIIQVGILEINYCKKKIIFYKDKNHNDDYIYGFWQYGKDFALTKEELL